MKLHHKNQSKKLLSLCLLAFIAFLTINKVQSQVWIDNNAKWTYDLWNVGINGTYEFEYTSDTIISGITCEKIEVTSHKYGLDYLGNPVYYEEEEDTRYTYASGDSVFHYSNGQFHLLYDFSASVGDSWIVDITDFGNNCNDTAIVQVVATGTTEMNGEELRTITLEPVNNSYLTIRSTCVERFGSKINETGDIGIGPFPGYQICDGGSIQPDILELRCYSDDSFPLYNFSDVACDFQTGSGSDYLFFEPDQKKVFASPGIADTVYSIAFDTVYEAGYYSWFFENFKVFGDWIEADDCEFWGPPECLSLNHPSWLGAPVKYDNNGLYTFYNLDEEPVNINVTLQLGDSALIYEDSQQAFYMKAMGEELTEILGITDTVKKFEILHYTPEGSIINSDLHQHEIVVGQTLGLTSFFRIDHFPEILIPQHLIGNTAPEAGLTTITNADLYDYQPGDVVQYKIIEHAAGGPPSDNFIRYDKYTYLTREESSDNLIYTAEKTSFHADSATASIDTVELTYQKNIVIDSIPFGRPEKTEFSLMKNKRLFQEDYCGQLLWTYETDRSYLGYCAADDCWGPQDIFGLPITDRKDYVFGLGLYSSHIQYENSFQGKSVIYFDKGEYSCGEELFVGIEEVTLFENYFEVYPNPVSNQLTVSNLKNIEGWLSIYDTQGRSVLIQKMNRGRNVIQTEFLKKGLYIIKIESPENTFQSKFVKQ